MRVGLAVYYLHGDHLGSVSMSTDASGNLISQARFTPFGEELTWDGNEESPTDFTFTGQRAERGFGLMDYNARFYSNNLGRFISADTIVPGAGNPMAWDRFAYTENNHLKYTDPTGHCINSDGNYVPGGPGGYGDPCPSSSSELPEPIQPLGDDKDTLEIPTPESPGLTTPSYDTGEPGDVDPEELVPPSDLVLFWEWDRLTGGGFHLDVGGMLFVIGGNIGVDLIYNEESNQLSLFVTPSALGGIGFGPSISGGPVGLYDTVENSDLTGWGGGLQITVIPTYGAAGSYSKSKERGVNGKFPQTYALTFGGGEEFSGAVNGGYTMEWVQLDFGQGEIFIGPWQVYP